ncbi:MAG: YggS family pyridoxal phosphate-dependent enzyme [Candidatus Binatia bacterium]|nr:YggS family pyridoxal phosphate-dependent enzyme [Candidatus Binatia bacterium]
MRGEIAARAVACGRPWDAVRLVTVTKGHPAEKMAAAIAAGAADVGENYVQEARAKRDEIGGEEARWHLIGPLQRNKAAVAGDLFDVVHTIDRAETAEALARRLPTDRASIDVLLQVNVARDPAKAGVLPEAVSELLQRTRALERVRVTGLMTIGRAGATSVDVASTFAELRDLRDGLRASGHEAVAELSMGMSGDYDAAIEQGATLVRLGTAILGPRPPRQEAERA